MINLLTSITLDSSNGICVTTTKEPVKSSGSNHLEDAAETVVSVLLEKALTEATCKIWENMNTKDGFNKLVDEAINWTKNHVAE